MIDYIAEADKLFDEKRKKLEEKYKKTREKDAKIARWKRIKKKVVKNGRGVKRSIRVKANKGVKR